MDVTGKVIVTLLHRDPQDEQGDTGGCTCPSRCSRVNTYPGARLTDGTSSGLGPLRKLTFCSTQCKKNPQNNLTLVICVVVIKIVLLKTNRPTFGLLAYTVCTVALFTYCLYNHNFHNGKLNNLYCAYASSLIEDRLQHASLRLQ